MITITENNRLESIRSGFLPDAAAKMAEWLVASLQKCETFNDIDDAFKMFSSCYTEEPDDWYNWASLCMNEAMGVAQTATSHELTPKEDYLFTKGLLESGNWKRMRRT